jgi:hypothetical protein
MRFPAIVSALALVALAPLAVPAAAQDLSADVRTWGGQSLRLGQASFEVFYTIFPPEKEETTGAGSGDIERLGTRMQGVQTGNGRLQAMQFFGSLRQLGALLDRGPNAMQGNKKSDFVTLYRGGVERQIPVASISSLTFQRRLVENSTLPPYVASKHYRYAATATLLDGSRLEADYVNLGTALLRGTTPDGRVDVPWQDIESIRFSR